MCAATRSRRIDTKLKQYSYEEVHDIGSISKNTVIYQDMKLSEGQKVGWRSRGYDGNPWFAAHETRVARFAENLNDYIVGNPLGRRPAG